MKGLRFFDRGQFANAMFFWKPLAEAGDCDAAYRYGVLFALGAGVPKDLDVARDWWTKAANQGNYRAQLMLAMAAKKMVHGERLRGDDQASRIRLKAGQRQVTDGPFTETKEILGGFYLIDCDSMAEAIEWAKKIPLGEGSSIDIRTVWPM